MPPPRVRPATPVVEMMPAGVARPYSVGGTVDLAHTQPPPTRTVRAPRIDLDVLER